MRTHSGCVYHKPPPRFAPQEVEDLSAYALSNMKLVGLPIKESHSGNNIGTVTDEWSGEDGSKYVSFDITTDSQVVHTALDTKILSHLSLSHEVGNPPRPVEISICSKGRRHGTTISPLSPSEYKGMTIAKEQTSPKSSPSTQEAPIIMASNQAQATPAPQAAAAPIPPGIVPTANDIPANTGAPPAETAPPAQATPAAQPQNESTKNGPELAASDPDRYMQVFRQIVETLGPEDKEIFVQGQLQAMKEKEQFQKELVEAKKTNETMAKTHQENLNNTMATIRNFFLQGADQKDGMTEKDLSSMEGALQSNPELQSPLSRLVQCAARRVVSTQESLKVHQKVVEQTASERELFARMRGIARDEANPTYNYHGFEQPRSNKRSLVSENANTAQGVAPPVKRARTNIDEQLKQIAAGMNSTLPARPTNIYEKEQFPTR